jgi:hypothetical protein
VPPRRVALVAFSLVFLAAAPAHAQTPSTQTDPARTARAEKLFDEGKRHLDAGRVPEACTAFAQSRELDPQLGTLLNLALCHEREGKVASAWAEFNEVVSVASRASQAKRAEFAKLRATALEQRLSRVVFTIDPHDADTAQVKVDGTDVKRAVLEGTPIPLDPGTHTAVLSAPGKKDTSLTFDVAAGPSTATVKLPMLEARVIVRAPPDKKDEEQLVLGESLTTWGWIATAVGAATFATGGVFGVLALDKKGDVDAACPTSQCRTESAFDEYRSADTYATVSTVLVIAGAAIAAGGVVLLVTSKSRSTPTAALAAPLVVRF